MNKATRGRSVGKDGTGEGRGKEPAWYTTGLAERVDGWVASVGRGRSRLLFCCLTFVLFCDRWRVEKTKRNRRKGCGWLVKVAAGTEDNEDSKGRGPTGGRWPVVVGGWGPLR